MEYIHNEINIYFIFLKYLFWTAVASNTWWISGNQIGKVSEPDATGQREETALPLQRSSIIEVLPKKRST